jgi:hypothetical protein
MLRLLALALVLASTPARADTGLYVAPSVSYGSYESQDGDGSHTWWNLRAGLGAVFDDANFRVQVGATFGAVRHDFGVHPAVGVEGGVEWNLGPCAIGAHGLVAISFRRMVSGGLRVRRGVAFLELDAVAFKDETSLDPGFFLVGGAVLVPTKRQTALGAGVLAGGALLVAIPTLLLFATFAHTR